MNLGCFKDFQASKNEDTGYVMVTIQASKKKVEESQYCEKPATPNSCLCKERRRMGIIREIPVAEAKVLVEELDDAIDSITGRPLTGSWVWDSALVLSRWMSTHLNFQGKSVLELGAGAGLPGLTAALLGATRVVLTDVQQLLPGLLKNVEANGFTDKVEVKQLVLGSDDSGITESSTFDIVLMSDVFFDSEDMIGLGKTLKRVCGEATQVWGATEMRPWTGECLDQLMAQGFQVVEQETSQLSVHAAVQDSNTFFAIFQIKPTLAESSQSWPAPLF